MTRLGSAFGSKYNTEALRTKTFELGGHIFKVRIPLTKEMDEIQSRVTKFDEAELLTRFNKMTASFRTGKPVEGIVITKDDVTVDGRSTKELVESTLITENQIVAFIKLLVPEEGTLDELTYADVDAEWPIQVQLELLAKITEAIQPGYKVSRGN
jgi:hypothetical protein